MRRWDRLSTAAFRKPEAWSAVFDEYAENTAAFVFERSAEKWADRPFLCVGPLATRSYLPEGWEITYGEAAKVVADLRQRYARAGYGFGHRVAILLENRPDFHLHFLALNGLGTSIVPLNPDYRPDESRYAIEHSEACLIVALPEREKATTELAATCAQKPAVVAIGPDFTPPPAPLEPPLSGEIGLRSEASLLYTSGTTGRPKGCVIPNEYYRNVGRFYTEMGGLAALRDGVERVFNPLPLFHMNAGVTSFMGMILKGGCSILPDRFHPGSWWREIIDSRATVAHYLGVVPAMLMKAPPAPDDRAHGLKFCVGAGVEPELHEPFEKSFGVPLIELWGMTETGGGFIAKRGSADNPHARLCPSAADVPALISTCVSSTVTIATLRSASKASSWRAGTGRQTRAGLLRRNLKNPQATAEAWRGDWFHTGDVVRRDESACCSSSIATRTSSGAPARNRGSGGGGDAARPRGGGGVAVMAVADEVREEEVIACIVPRAGFAADDAPASKLFNFANEKLAYYKPPGWIVFIEICRRRARRRCRRGNLPEERRSENVAERLRSAHAEAAAEARRR